MNAALLSCTQRSGNAFHPINEVTLRPVRLVLGWVTVCEQVNHHGMCNQPTRSTQPSIPLG